MTVRVDEAKVDESPGFVRFRFDEFRLLVHEKSGFFNDTQLCPLGYDNYANYVGSQRCADLEGFLWPRLGDDLMLSFDTAQLNVADEAPVHGVYVHPLKLLDVAGWLSDELYVKCAVAAAAFFGRTPQRRRQLKTRLRIGDAEARVVVVDERRGIRRIGEVAAGGVQLLEDEDGWINASKLCEDGRPYEAFEGDEDAGPLLELLDRYLGEWPCRMVDSSKPMSGWYVHPIVAIRLLLWRGPEPYSRLAGVILTRMCKATSAKEDESAALADRRVGQSQVASGTEPMAIPSTSATAAAFNSCRDDLPASTFEPTCIVWDNGDNDLPSDGSGAATPPTGNADVELEVLKKEHEIAVARLVREKESQIERLQREKAAEAERLEAQGSEIERLRREILAKEAELAQLALAKEAELAQLALAKEAEVARLAQEKAAEAERVRDHESEIGRLQREKAAEAERLGAKDTEIDELRKQIEDMSLHNERLRAAKLKEDSKARRICNLAAGKRGVAKLECVLALRLRSMPNALYAIRRQFSGLVRAVLDKLEDVQEFVFWYATDNAVQDFNVGKNAAVALEAATSSEVVRLATAPNAIRVIADEKSAPAADLAHRVRTEVDRVLRAMGLIELDVFVLRALFRDQRPDAVEEFAANTTNETKRAVYRWLREAYKSESSKKRKKLEPTPPTPV